MQKTPLSQMKKRSYYNLSEDNFFTMREKCENFNCINDSSKNLILLTENEVKQELICEQIYS